MLLASMLCCLLTGSVQSASGTPLESAHIVLTGPQTLEATADAAGHFHLQAVPGRYVLRGTHEGYAPVTVAPVIVQGDTEIRVVLEPSNTPELRTIGSVTVNGRLARVAGAVPSVIVPRAQMEATGYQRVSQALLEVPSLDLQYSHNAGADGLTTVSLRGPDPSETLVTLDGQVLNDANTGDVDISQLPVAAFNSVSVVEGLGPQDIEGSNTIGGAVNLISLRPTRQPHSAVSLSTGSFGQNEAWFNATGSHSKFGYALAADDQQASGYVNETDIACTNPADPSTCAPVHLGSWRAQRSLLGNFTYSFDDRSSVGLRMFSLGDMRDQSAGIAGIDNASGVLLSPGTQTFSQTIRAYDFNGHTPLGAGDLVFEYSQSDNNVDVSGQGIGDPMYDLSHKDVRVSQSLQWERDFEGGSIAFGGYLRQETFVAPGAVPQIGQNIGSYFVRGTVQPVQKLHLAAGAYLSHYTTFGSNVDGRISAVYDTDPTTSVRFSAGTGFRAPLLIERYVFPTDQLPPPDPATCVVPGQGNPNERPEHATEYELGVSHQFGSVGTIDASAYRTNLRDAIENYFPANTANPGCGTVYYSYPINVGNAVYEGAELRYTQRIPSAHMYVTAQYGLNVAYPRNMPDTVSNPTSGAFIVDNQQFANIPQQQASLEADYDYRRLHFAVAAVHRGNNNPLHQPPLTFINALAGFRVTPNIDLSLAGTNLTNAAAGKFQVFNGGQPYYGYVAPGQLGPIATNRLTLEPASLRFTVTFRQ